MIVLNQARGGAAPVTANLVRRVLGANFGNVRYVTVPRIGEIKVTAVIQFLDEAVGCTGDVRRGTCQLSDFSNVLRKAQKVRGHENGALLLEVAAMNSLVRTNRGDSLTKLDWA